MKKFLTLGFVALAICLAPSGTRAQRRGFVPRRTADASRRAKNAAKVFTDIMRAKDKSIPKELLEDAEAVAVFPGVLKAAFIVGGRKGQGVVTRRTAKGWTAPAFYNLSGGSVGAQVGGEKTDYVLLVMNPEGLKGLMEDKFEVGGEAGVAAGPVGRTLAASTNPTLDAAILSYSRSKGVFIGAALKGVAITPDNDLNEAFYGKDAREVLNGGTSPPTLVRALPLALSRYSVRAPEGKAKKQ
jgi:lipid-binding SYLF domain-containing protein